MPAATDTLLVHLVDDDESVRNSLARLLRASGIMSQLHGTPEDFLSAAPADGMGCILLDLTMPRMSGLEFIKRIQKRGYSMPVVVISARDDDETRRMLRDLGVKFYLRKPVDEQALIDCIHWVAHDNDTSRSDSA